MGVYINLGRATSDNQVFPLTCNTHCSLHASVPHLHIHGLSYICPVLISTSNRPLHELVNDPPSTAQPLHARTHTRTHLLKYVVPCSVDSREYLGFFPLLHDPPLLIHASSVVLHLFAICHLPLLLLFSFLFVYAHL